MTIFDEMSCFFRIREHTRNEFLAVGTASGGLGREVLRWQESRDNDQLWLVLPKGENDKGETEIQVISAVDNGVPSPLFLTMYPMSNPAIFTAFHRLPDGAPVPTPFGPIDPETFPQQYQTFRLMNGDENTFNIQEPTKNEYAGIAGVGGRLIRWGWNGGADQLFTFEPWQPPAPPPLHVGDPGEIGDIPRVKNVEIMPPEHSKSRLVGEIAVPSALVHDGHFSNKLIQFQRSPYYILRREQYWDRTGDNGYYHYHTEGEARTDTVTLVYRVTVETTETEEKTFGVEFSVTGGANFMGITASFSTKVSNVLKVTKVTHESIVKERTDSFTVEYKSDVRECVFVCWSLVDKYTLLRVTKGGREPLQTWTVPQFNTKKTDSCPPGSVTVDGRPVEDI